MASLQLSDRRSRLVGIALVSSSSVFFGTIPIFAAVLSRAGVGVWVQVAARFTVSALIFSAGFLLITGKRPPLPSRADLLFPLVNGTLLLLAFATYILSIALGTPPNKVIVISFLFPLFAVLFGGIFLKEPLTLRKWAALAVGFAGIVLTLEVWTLDSLASIQIGDLFALMNSVMVGLILVVGRWGRSRRRIPPLNLTLWSFGVALGLLSILGLLDILLNGGAQIAQQLAFDRADPGLILGLLGIATLSTAIPYLLMYTGLGRVHSSLAGILLLPEVIAVFIMSAIFLGQPVGGWQVAGAAVILLAGLMVMR
jgi:drug/metabolite transporter (DMT)-like permease